MGNCVNLMQQQSLTRLVIFSFYFSYSRWSVCQSAAMMCVQRRERRNWDILENVRRALRRRVNHSWQRHIQKFQFEAECLRLIEIEWSFNQMSMRQCDSKYPNRIDTALHSICMIYYRHIQYLARSVDDVREVGKIKAHKLFELLCCLLI